MNYWKTLISPFKPFKLKFYCGKVAIGTPYFFPRKLVKVSKEEATNKAFVKYIELKEKGKHIPFDTLYEEESERMIFVPKTFGFDFVRLGWKTKWEPGDYRFEWAPLWSFVFFKWQIAVIVVAPHQDRYWECWLYYERNTDKTKSTAERIAQARKGFPCKWKVYKKDNKETIDYWNLILKKKWLK